MSTNNNEPSPPAEAKDMGKHDMMAELRDAFAETKKDPSSLWKKPETLRPGKDLAVVGLGVGVLLLLLLLVTSSSILGVLCFLLGLGALLVSLLGLKTQGRPLAFGGLAAGVLVLLLALAQTFGSSKAAPGPAEVVRTVLDAYRSGNHAALIANVTGPLSDRERHPEDFAEMSQEMRERGITFSVGEVQVKGDIASVRVTALQPGRRPDSGEMELRKVDGVWKVDSRSLPR